MINNKSNPHSLSNNLEVLGKYIEYHIKKKGSVSYNQAAKTMNISTGELCQIRTGRRLKPNPLILKKIADNFDANLDVMMDILLGKISKEVMQVLEDYEELLKLQRQGN